MTGYYIAVDPGKNACGVSIWGLDRNLIHASLIKNTSKIEGKQRAELWGDMANIVAKGIISHLPFPYGLTSASLILEIPQVYEKQQDEDKNDLLDLAGVQGAIVVASGFPVAWSPTPAQWKGQLKKRHSVKRVESRLSVEEFQRVEWPAPSLRHNVWDALHLGLVYLERQGLR